VVRRVYELAAAGRTDREVGKATGLALKHVAEILTNPFYIGRLWSGEESALGAEPEGNDFLAQARLKRERERAALQFAKDRDFGRLEATLARLDAEAEAARERPSRRPTAAEARAYLESLPELWAKTSDAGRKAIAEAVFERIDVLGAREFTFTVTAAAKARGWDAAFGPGVLRLDANVGRGYSRGPGAADKCAETGVSTHEKGRAGRGERTRASATRQIRGCTVTIGGREGPVDLTLTA
jgi:hypothetical protein